MNVIAEANGFEILDFGGGDLHIRDTSTNVSFRVGRINKHGWTTVVTSQSKGLVPYSVNGLPAFLIK